MAKREQKDNAGRDDFLDLLWGKPEGSPRDAAEGEAKPPQPDPRPSLQTIGFSDCSVCGREVSVMLTKSGHPFTACGWCGARTFFNSRVAIGILKGRLREIKND